MDIQDTDVTTAKLPKRKSVTLTAGAGEKLMKLTILARRTREGGEAIVTTTDVKRKTARGMTKKFATFELAVAELGKLVQEATQKGWHKPERAAGFRARPDAFSTIPTAPKVTK